MSLVTPASIVRRPVTQVLRFAVAGALALASVGIAGMVGAGPAFAVGEGVSDWYEIHSALDDGDSVYLENDIDPTTGPSDFNCYALPIASGAYPTIDLNGNDLTVPANYCSDEFGDGEPGIGVDAATTLVITDSVGGGVLNVTGGAQAAAIGTALDEPSGAVVIEGATVYANGEGGAGIGAGRDGVGGTLTVNGGWVVASGSPGVGGMSGGSAVTVNSGGLAASGAGPGDAAISATTVIVNGGNLTATGGSAPATYAGAPAIVATDVTIGAGTLSATGGFGSAGVDATAINVPAQPVTGSDTIGGSGYTPPYDDFEGTTDPSAPIVWSDSAVVYGRMVAVDAPSSGGGGTTTIAVQTPVSDWAALWQQVAGAPAMSWVVLADDVESAAGAALPIQPGADVTIDLDGLALGIDASRIVGTPAIGVGAGSALTITDSSGGQGVLTATGGASSAGIGGVSGVAGGSVVLDGGQVTATGGSGAAGIGGGAGGAGGVVAISDGTVVATGGASGAGIGGGSGAAGGTVTIAGGSIAVTATGGSGGAGIGGGSAGDGGTTTIGAGFTTLSATGGAGAAGIGGGSGGAGGAVSIPGGAFVAGSGASFAASGGAGGAGIGAGAGGASAGTLLVGARQAPGSGVTGGSGGTGAGAVVTWTENAISSATATTTDGAAGGFGIEFLETASLWGELQSLVDIATGATTYQLTSDIVGDGASGLVVPVGSDVTIDLNSWSLSIDASASSAVAAIAVPVGSSVTIVDTSPGGGGQLDASGGDYAAGIGGVNATIGTADYEPSAGDAGAISILGGTVTASGAWGSAAIGGGWGGTVGTVTIGGGVTVNATGGSGGAGVGGGTGGSGGAVAIIGPALVTATSEYGGAGIGGGGGTAGGTIVVDADPFDATGTTGGTSIVGTPSVGGIGSPITASPGMHSLSYTAVPVDGAGGAVTLSVGHFVSFDAGDGAAPPPTQFLLGETPATQPPTPVRSGFTFEGWQVGAGGALWDFAAAVMTDLDLVALWSSPIDVLQSVIDAGGTQTIVLDADIDAAAGEALEIPVGADITVDLAGYLLAITDPPSGVAAIGVPVGATFGIIDSSIVGSGRLNAIGVGFGAGIGGADGAGAGSITIGGGTVVATGGVGAAGIGGGAQGAGGAVTIARGTVSATGGAGGAGIGSGVDSSDGSGTLAVSAPAPAAGGATGGSAPGLLGGAGAVIQWSSSAAAKATVATTDGVAGAVTISVIPFATTWSQLVALVSAEPAAIRIVLGASISSAGAALAVNDGTSVTIDLSGYALDIDASSGSEPGIRVNWNSVLTIADSSPGGTGSLSVVGGDESAGIGIGDDGAAGAVTIDGGNVSARGGASGAGIGGGNGVNGGGDGGTVTINGGTVTAVGGDYGAGIGAGLDGDFAGTITVNATPLGVQDVEGGSCIFNDGNGNTGGWGAPIASPSESQALSFIADAADGFPSGAVTIVVGYAVTFDSAGGTAIDPQLVLPGGTVVVPPAPARAGFDFGGWLVGAAGPAWTTGTPVDSALGLVASWTVSAVPPTVVRDPIPAPVDGVRPASQPVTTPTLVPTPVPMPTAAPRAAPTVEPAPPTVRHVGLDGTDGPESGLIPGESIQIDADGFDPFEAVEVVLHSDPFLLGTLEADGAGRISGVLQIPADAPAGQHTIVATGATSGRVVSLTVMVVERPAFVDWSPWLLTTLGALVVLAITAVVVAVRRRIPGTGGRAR